MLGDHLILMEHFQTKFGLRGTPFAVRTELGQFLAAWECFFVDLDALLAGLIDETT